jgi:uncharacterized protein with ParB-like and HNH nuclease domain
MSNEREIKSEKILVKTIFSTMWFRIPEYQRPYIWSKDEVNELLDDLTFAEQEKADQEYFLGSFVFQAKKADPARGYEFDENDLLDGQQRMTTLLLLFACIRDLSKDQEAKADCQSCIFQKGSVYKNVPERNRIVFAIRDEVQAFVDDFIKTPGGTDREEELGAIISKQTDKSLQNMAQAVLEIRRFLKDPESGIAPEQLLQFLMNNVMLIYVATQALDDAFRLFTILNNRGVPLRNSDILKSLNLGELQTDKEKVKYAQLWEEAESSLGDDFDRFLNHIRTLLVKEKARLNVLQEFEDKIYDPNEKDKSTGQKKPALLKKGKDTFQYVERYLKHYNQLLGGGNFDDTDGSFRFDNLVRVMSIGLPSTDWVPPLLRYFDQFKYKRLLDFLVLLDNKFSADWISQYTPTDRIEQMNQIIKVIELAENPETVLADPSFAISEDAFLRAVESAVYGRRFTRYLLLKLDYLYQDHSHRMTLDMLSVEHILPQTPAEDSKWLADFSENDRDEWTDRLGNLVLISTKKNTSQGRLDFADKKTRYFSKCISTCPNSLRVLQSMKWTLTELKANHSEVLTQLASHYGISQERQHELSVRVA